MGAGLKFPASLAWAEDAIQAALEVRAWPARGGIQLGKLNKPASRRVRNNVNRPSPARRASLLLAPSPPLCTEVGRKQSPFPLASALSAEVQIPRSLLKAWNKDRNDSSFLPAIVSLRQAGEVFALKDASVYGGDFFCFS